MSDINPNLELWEALRVTPTTATKPFQRAGGFRGKSIDPMYRYRRMTEHFGPCGKGWGIGKPEYQIVPAGDEILVFCILDVWWMTPDKTGEIHSLIGVGGDKVLTKGKYGISADDEGFKKAMTDAVGNAMKYIGIGADVYMGQHDDDKYVRALQHQEDDAREFPQGNFAAGHDAAPSKSSAELKRRVQWEDEFKRELYECQSLPMLEKFRIAWKKIADRDGWNTSFRHAAQEMMAVQKDTIMSQMSPENLAVLPVKETLKASLRQSTQRPLDDDFPGDR